MDLAIAIHSTVSIESVQFKVNGANIGSALTAPPWATTYDTTALANGEHTFSVVVRDIEGNTSESYGADDATFSFEPYSRFLASGGMGDNAFIRNTGNGINVVNGVASFDGTSFFDAPNPPERLVFTDAEPFTIVAKIKPTTINSTSYFNLKDIFVHLGANDGNTTNYHLQVTDEHTISFGVRVTGNNIKLYNFTNILPSGSLLNRETHLVLVYNGAGNISLYVDGVLNATKALTVYTDSNTSSNAYFGTYGDNTHLRIGGIDTNASRLMTNFIGEIHALTIHDKALSVADITRLYQGQSLSRDTVTVNVENIANANSTGGVPAVVRGVNIFDKNAYPLANVQNLATWGANVQRVQITLPVVTGQDFATSWAASKAFIEQVVQDAEATGIKCIIDLHVAPILNYSVTKAVWTDPTFESQFITCWTDLATMLLPYSSTIYGFDLYNEPNEPFNGYWRALAIQLIAAIRAIDTNVWIIYEPARLAYNEAFRYLTPLPDKRVIYSFHFYRANEFTHQRLSNFPYPNIEYYPTTINGVLVDRDHLYSIMEHVKHFADTHNVPIFVGELSVARWAPIPDALQWYADVLDYIEARGWSWAHHAYRTSPQGKIWDLEYDESYPTQSLAVGETQALTLLKSYWANNS